MNNQAIEQVSSWVCISVIIFSSISIFQIASDLTISFPNGEFLFDRYRYASTLYNKNFLAETLFLSLPFVCYSLLNSNGRKRIIPLFATLLCFIFIFLIKNLTVTLALFTVVWIYFLLMRKEIFKRISFYNKKKKSGLIFSGLIILLIGFLYFMNLKTKIQSLSLIEETSLESKAKYNDVSERFLIWKKCVKIISDKPVFGIGQGNWQILYQKYGLFGNEKMDEGFLKVEHPHNDYLMLLVEGGIVNLFLYLMLFTIILFQLFHQIRNSGEGRMKQFFAFLFCAVTGFMFISLFSFPKERTYSWFLLMIIFAFSFFEKEKSNIEERGDSKDRLLYLFFLITSLFCTTVFYYRAKGEWYYNKALKAQFEKHWSLEEENISASKSWCFRFDPSSVPLQWYEGKVRFNESDFITAKNLFLESNGLNKYSVQIKNDLGAVYDRLNSLDSSESYFLDALKLNPDYGESILNLSIFYFNHKKQEKAYQTLLKHKCTIRRKEYRDILFPILQWKIKNDFPDLNDNQKKLIEIKFSDGDYLYRNFIQAKATDIDYLILLIKNLSN